MSEGLFMFLFVALVVSYMTILGHALFSGRLLWFVVMLIAAPAALLYPFATKE